MMSAVDNIVGQSAKHDRPACTLLGSVLLDALRCLLCGRAATNSAVAAKYSCWARSQVPTPCFSSHRAQSACKLMHYAGHAIEVLWTKLACMPFADTGV